MSSTLIPLLSADLPFFEFVDCSLQLFCQNLWNSHHLIRVSVAHKTLAIPFRDVMTSSVSFLADLTLGVFF